MTRQAALPPSLAPRMVRHAAAAAYIGVSPTTFSELVRQGRMPRPRIISVGVKAWDVRDLDASLDDLPTDGVESPTSSLAMEVALGEAAKA